jgi:arylsulfatase A-like enzyme
MKVSGLNTAICSTLALTIFSTGLTTGKEVKKVQQKPNVVYILTDQWRASAFGYSGDPNVKTPQIDNFAKEAVNFSNAVSVCPVCTPYRASLLTGRYPTSTGMFLNDLYLPDQELCMAEIFKSEGYQTAYLGKWHLDGHGRSNNVAPERRQGFDYWKGSECSHDYLKEPYFENILPGVKYWEGYSPFSIAKDAQDYLSNHAKSNIPFLLFVSISTPHFPHGTAPKEYQDLYPESSIRLAPNVPEEMRQKVFKELKGYYGHCTATDKAIGELIGKIKELGLMENTIVVFTSDHGEMMGAHGVHPNAKQLAWDESIRVPFLISYPGMKKNKGLTIKAPITTPDILPSLLGMAGIKIPKSIEGEDLSGLIKSPDSKLDRTALVMQVSPFATEFANKEYRGIRTSQYTYVCSPEKATMLFDNLADPYQMDNLAGKPEYGNLQAELDEKLHLALTKIGDDPFKPRGYYLKKWNLKLNSKDSTHIDYNGFLQGEGKVITPILEK